MFTSLTAVLGFTGVYVCQSIKLSTVNMYSLSQLYFSRAIEKHNHPQGEMPLLRKAKTDLGSVVG